MIIMQSKENSYSLKQANETIYTNLSLNSSTTPFKSRREVLT